MSRQMLHVVVLKPRTCHDHQALIYLRSLVQEYDLGCGHQGIA